MGVLDRIVQTPVYSNSTGRVTGPQPINTWPGQTPKSEYYSQNPPRIEGPQPINTWPGQGVSDPNTFDVPTDIMPYSGLPPEYRDQLLSFVMPQLQQQVTNMPGNIDEYTQNALMGYRQELDRAIKEMLPKQIGRLANRGVLDSSVASDTMSKAVTQAATQSASKGYETAMNAALMKANIPNTIMGLLTYGQSQEDPTVIFQTMMQLLGSI